MAIEKDILNQLLSGRDHPIRLRQCGDEVPIEERRGRAAVSCFTSWARWLRLSALNNRHSCPNGLLPQAAEAPPVWRGRLA